MPTAIPNSLIAHFPVTVNWLQGQKGLYEVHIIHYIVVLCMAILPGGGGEGRGKALSDSCPSPHRTLTLHPWNQYKASDAFI